MPVASDTGHMVFLPVCAVGLRFLHTIQGDADPIVAPDVTARLAHKLCAEGETVDLRILKGTAHLDAGHVAVPDVVRWIADRFAGKPPPTTCT